ncbi:MAG TPA: site-specific DNA-methyltransferase, partial [Methanoregulaceae archaeon]|nr:site-specific DNA-methyltransferase [Methanoregulaceae archaeon]
MPEDSTKKLQSLLRKLFQFEHADLDFGIYRIMNKKRDAIENFIEKDLIAAVEAEFGKVSKSEMDQLETEVKALAKELGIGVDDDPATLREMGKKVPALQPLISKFEQKKSKLLNLANCDEYKAEVFNHIYQFFSRYYDNGDFMSLRRYSSKQKYAIPYNGEEVLLHWANKDQYYIKTGEYFFNYAFRIGDYTIRFQIVQAETSMNNVKGENRFFVLRSGEGNVTYDADAKELKVLFDYRALTDAEKAAVGTRNIQDTLNQQAKEAILAAVPVAGLKDGLTREIDGKTPLAKHLAIYAKKNTSDYFIHKDLGGFLRQELDFYIKNEMIDIDDLGTDREVQIEPYLNRVRVMKAISLKIIDFLAQIENFQKKLWEKKKFVIDTFYVITVGTIPEIFYAEIAKCEDQWKEWKELLHIDENQIGLFTFDANQINKRIAFLKSHPTLPLDTRHFPPDFVDRLLASFDDLDEMTDGLLVHSENWQALNMLQEKYRERVKCVYIDPPYNTGSDEFLYRDAYQHSSWLAMMENRLRLAKDTMRSDGSIFISNDDNEQAALKGCMDFVFGLDNFVTQIIWQKKFSPQNDAKYLSDNHDYLTLFARTKVYWRRNLLPRTDEVNARYENPDNDPRGPWMSSGLDVKTYAPEYDYPITTPSGRIVSPPRGACWRVSKERLKELISENRIWFGQDGNNVPRLKRFLSDVREGIVPLTIWSHKEVGHNQEAKQQLKAIMGDLGDVFQTPKPARLLQRCFQIGADSNSTILDYFAGSGTTGHAVINLNREDGGKRKFILVEMAQYFDTVLLPRIKKVTFTPEWKDGKPKRMATSEEAERSPRIIQVLGLEQYEDTLNNIEFIEGGTAPKTLMDFEGYFLRYMLDFETRESPCRMNVTKLERPFDYT